MTTVPRAQQESLGILSAKRTVSTDSQCYFLTAIGNIAARNTRAIHCFYYLAELSIGEVIGLNAVGSVPGSEAALPSPPPSLEQEEMNNAVAMSVEKINFFMIIKD